MSFYCFVGKIEPDLSATVQRSLDWVRWKEVIPAGARVFIKPNFTIPHYKIGVTTSPKLLEALVQSLKERTSSIAICESNGALSSFRAEQGFVGHGLSDFPARYGVRLLNLSSLPARRIPLPSGRETIELPEILLEECECLITVPVLKTHMMTTVTLGLKNLWGCIPNPNRIVYHANFREAIVEIARLLRPRLSIIDAIWGLDGHGPIAGTPRRLDTLIASQELASEIAGCKIMGIDFGSVRYLVDAQRQGVIPREHEVVLNQPVESLGAPPFHMRRDLIAWGAAALFRSRKLSELVYLSPLSKVKNKVVLALRGEQNTYA